MRSQIRAEEAKTWPSTVFNTSSLPKTAAEYPGHVEAELDRAELDKVTVICVQGYEEWTGSSSSAAH